MLLHTPRKTSLIRNPVCIFTACMTCFSMCIERFGIGQKLGPDNGGLEDNFGCFWIWIWKLDLYLSRTFAFQIRLAFGKRHPREELFWMTEPRSDSPFRLLHVQEYRAPQLFLGLP
ncbi:hypothetical protein CPC08DRAFT_91560 [Agrocybe pediades]|nr:hypothetical protein CPC08DRAFT_91560 [Agrocybe pediades]